MNDPNFHDHFNRQPEASQEPEIIVAEAVPEAGAAERRARAVPSRSIQTPLLLFLATCLSTFAVGGWVYALCLMTILVCHEMGHFLQARRYGVFASFPYFIPMPISPIGTFGAVIVMQARMGHRRALFDIGVTGPLAGLVPTLIFCFLGLQWSEIKPLPHDGAGLTLGEPLLFQAMAHLTLGPLPEGKDIILHPMAFAGWVGLLITAINLFPIGQLDGGHVLYAVLRGWARPVAQLLLLAAVVAVAWFGLWGWTLMLMLLVLMGPHPPTADDDVPLGGFRYVLGWLVLALIPFGFTPTPLVLGQ